MIREGVLSPSESGNYIAQNAKHVKINKDGIEKLCTEMMPSISNKLKIPDTGTVIKQPSRDDPRAVDWVFVADALNFCFWSFTGAEKWTVNGHSGYYALEAALSRALEDGQDITNPEYYSKITDNQLRHIMRSDNSTDIPLFENRFEVLREVGKILIEKYDGTFKTCIKEANKSASKLLKIIVNGFPCFRDEAYYKSNMVSFYKRAQILVADIWNFFDGESFGEFHDIDQITMFADYRVPQVLVYFGAMSYSDELMTKLKKDEIILNGSTEEIEIRGCSIHAVEILKQRIEEKIKEDNLDAEVPNSGLIDYYLWCYRRKYADQLESIPFHKTFGIYY